MMDEKILEILNKKFEEEVKSIVQVLCDGGATSYDHYKELSGIIRGLRTAQRELGDLVRKLKESNDD
jgi:hypothetical protein